MTTQDTIRILGQAVYNMRYEQFRTALDLEDDQYARDKYDDMKAFARAMAPFSNAELAQLTRTFAASNITSDAVGGP